MLNVNTYLLKNANLSWVKTLRLDRFVLESDALQVARCLHNSDHVDCLGLIIDDCCFLLKYFN